MKSYIKILFIILFLSFAYSSNAQNDSTGVQFIPTQAYNYRFMGDTTEISSIIKYYTNTDTLSLNKNVFPYTERKHKEWTRFYGYANVWWIDYNINEWINRWQLGYYWKYNIINNVSDVITITLDKNEIVLLQRYLIFKQHNLGETGADGIYGYYTKTASLNEIENNVNAVNNLIDWYKFNSSEEKAIKTLFYLRQIY